MREIEVKNQGIFESISLKVPFSSTCNYACDYCRGSNRELSTITPASMEDFRSTPLSEGSLTTEEMTQILRYLYTAGFRRIRPTGGEPLLRTDWYELVEEANAIGYQDIELTTNGQLLNRTIETHHGVLPKGLSLLKVSLDILDPVTYSKLSGWRGNLDEVVKGIDKVTELGVPLRLNTVVLRDTFTPEWISQMIDFCATHKINSIQFLDLIHFPNLPNHREKGQEWNRQYIDFIEFQNNVRTVFPDANFIKLDAYGGNFWRFNISSNGANITATFSDSRETMRDEQCGVCMDYCQKGRGFIRLGTDGNLTPCPDYQANLPDHFNVLESIHDGSLNDKLEHIAFLIASAKKINSLVMFKHFHHIENQK